MLCSIEIPRKKLTLDLALIQWYDFKIQTTIEKLYKFGCPWLRRLDIFDFVLTDSISNLVHIVQRFDKENEYFVNIFMF
jgi:hypothetical protein